ncbi:MAG: outer membrane lipoprotein chaperone LolA [Gammaproteobacteria bacterium]|nr:outer membrane lipoprotein chaperone LolA [Gammaproteobacteria bacterium]
MILAQATFKHPHPRPFSRAREKGAIYCCFITLLFSFPTHATPDGEHFIQQLNAIHSLKANFQEKVVAHHRQISQATGRMEIVRPGRLRWQTDSPVSQLVLADGKQVFIYDKDLEQVTIHAQQKALRGTPALFLSDSTGALLSDYAIERHMNNAHLEQFDLRPLTHHATFTHLSFVFKNQQLQSMTLVDKLGQQTTLLFKQVQQNTAIPLSQFVFKLPRGVDVIRE